MRGTDISRCYRESDHHTDQVQRQAASVFHIDAKSMRRNTRRHALMQTHDLKARKWSNAAKDHGLDIEPVGYSMIYSPLVLMGRIITGRRPEAFVLRYLNDYQSLTKTCLRFIAEWLLVHICKLFSIETHWICHNVNRESIEYHPEITKRRRAALLANVETVFVTDKHLLEPARSYLNPNEDKLDWTCFGKLCQSYDRGTRAGEEIREFLGKYRSREAGTLAGLWVGVPFSGKKQHALKMIPRIVSCGDRLPVIMVVVGPLSENCNVVGRRVIDALQKNKRVLLIDRYVDVRKEPAVGDVDFFWKGVGDYSIPLTLYHAMSVGKPFLVPTGKFLREYVIEEGIGWYIEEDATNLAEAMTFVQQWNSRRSREFLARHSWRNAAGRLNSRIAK